MGIERFACGSSILGSFPALVDRTYTPGLDSAFSTQSVKTPRLLATHPASSNDQRP
jgi:hypothetical protein